MTVTDGGKAKRMINAASHAFLSDSAYARRAEKTTENLYRDTGAFTKGPLYAPPNAAVYSIRAAA